MNENTKKLVDQLVDTTARLEVLQYKMERIRDLCYKEEVECAVLKKRMGTEFSLNDINDVNVKAHMILEILELPHSKQALDTFIALEKAKCMDKLDTNEDE